MLTNRYFLSVQVREALRRSRVESRDLRASLFRAEDVIKQLTLTKAARRRGAHNSNAAQRDAFSPLSSPAAAADEKERRLVSHLLASGRGGGGGGGSAGKRRPGEAGGSSSDGRPSSSSCNSNNAYPVVGYSPTNAELDNSKTGMPSRESLLTRVQQLERQLRLADFRNARGMAAAGHGRTISVEEVGLSAIDELFYNLKKCMHRVAGL